MGIAHPDLPADTSYGAEHLPPDQDQDGALPETGEAALNAEIFAQMPLREAREAFERAYLLAQLERFGGNVSQTARFVGMERSALHRKLKTLEESAPALNGQEEGSGVSSLRRRA
jgi:DNA-binding NtrC family response regulator